jgi:hypothetical protein
MRAQGESAEKRARTIWLTERIASTTVEGKEDPESRSENAGSDRGLGNRRRPQEKTEKEKIGDGNVFSA